MRTKRIRVGSLGTNPYLPSPAEIATFVALDHLTDGRAVLDIGLHSDAMLHWLGYDTFDFVERVRETVIVVEALLAGETPSQELALCPWSDEWRVRFLRFRGSPRVYLPPFARRHHELAERSRTAVCQTDPRSPDDELGPVERVLYRTAAITHGVSSARQITSLEPGCPSCSRSRR
jgi:alkanesulfonate monooxygenase SsuD/methylene tetrahydromethanopterin reductase-like flavin-dependent oxidoreductase (luciferase family)